jgi:hypothetical protein
MCAAMNKQVKKTIKEINKILSEQCPTFTLNVDSVRHLDAIRSDTKLQFYEKTHTFGEPKVVTRMWKHFKYRGLPSVAPTKMITLYLVIMRNKKTGQPHYKFGTTKSLYVAERFLKKSSTWEFMHEAVTSRVGPKDQMLALEKRIKEFAMKNGLIQEGVEDFIFGGHTELLIPTRLMPVDKYCDLLRIFNDSGFDAL